MNSKVTPNELLSQVNQFWSLLDDMAENSPDSYKTFIQRHMNEGKDFMKPPEPFLCIQTKILLPEERLLFINICGWKRVPAPQSDLDPVPLIAGKLQDTSEGTVIDIAYSPVVLKGAESDRVEQNPLIRLAMKYIEQQHKVTLCHSYHIAPFRQKGNLQTLRNNLDGQQKKPKPTKEKSEKAPNTSLLEQLKNISVSADEKEKPSPRIEIMKESDPKPGKAGLIEVICSTELNEEDLLTPPQHELSIVNNPSGKPQKIILTAALHGVRSVSECDLSVSKDDLLLEVPGKYRLLLNLPVLVNEDSTTATYNKANDTLTVTMLVADNQGV
ncbi:PIH1 domain-containing protein 2 isoform X1 [Rana temporaria]|uniref:PIH1 domain-containing protein 2 isoform X1 n=1 Tax=Rana temporaria TaxID=8407 RepID=UPI001AAD8F7D|nr:PIH1 domain-containing protein 2 isoform X1 [Rana temporaria]